MKFVATCLLFSLLLFACRKERINPDEVRLLKTTQAGPNGSKININFEYDNQGRIVRITRDIDNASQKLIATISYNGNEAILVDTSGIDQSFKIARTIKFVLDNENKPLQRIQVETWRFSTTELDQRNFINDTTYYEYNSAGLLTQTRVANKDSVWFFHYANLSPDNNVNVRNLTRTFQSSNGNVISMTGVGIRFLKAININGTFIRNYAVEESISFDYSSAFRNQMDFKNAFILAEYCGNDYLSVMYPTSQSIPIYSFLNPRAKNIPDSRHLSISERDHLGVQVSTHSSTWDYNIFYNKYGFVSGVANASDANPDISFTYNR